MAKPGNKKKIKSDFYNRYGFDLGDSLLILPKNDGRSLYNFSKEELDDLITNAQKGKIVALSGQYGLIGREGITGPFYHFIHIECEDGETIVCNPIYYRLYGRFDKLGLNKPEPVRKSKDIKKAKLIKSNDDLIKRLKSRFK